MAAEALTGRLPGRSPDDGTVLTRSITGQLPSRLADLVLSCVAPDPNDRCASLAAFHKDLVAELRACETHSAAWG
jgi:serine/threonine protein kinase